MEGNLKGPPARGHVHSNIARIIANSLVIAQYEEDVKVFENV